MVFAAHNVNTVKVGLHLLTKKQSKGSHLLDTCLRSFTGLECRLPEILFRLDSGDFGTLQA